MAAPIHVLLKKGYSNEMAAPAHTTFTRWIVNQLWDNTGPSHQGFGGWLRPAWKLIAALIGSSLLDWTEWVEHHPPEMAIIALIHFVLILVAISLIVNIVRWLRPSEKT